MNCYLTARYKLLFSNLITEKKKRNNDIWNKKNINFKNNNFSKPDLGSKNNNSINSDLRLHEIADKIEYLLSTDGLSESAAQEYLSGHLESTLHIAVIFCKSLDRNQITVEFARRISTILAQIKNGKLKPDIIAFLGGQFNQTEISSASAGYIYFRYLSDKSKINLSGLNFIIEHSYSNFQDNLSILLISLENKYGCEAISRCHFTLISSDYHLIRISEIHKLSRRQSILTPLLRSGATWTYLFAAYPFCVSPDPTLAFLGRIRVLANELSVILVNLNGHLESNDFISKENFARLCETNRKLKIMLRKIFEQGSSINFTKNSLDIPLDYWEVLEQSLFQIHEVQIILAPLIDGKPIERINLIKARDIFMNALKDIKLTVDPDRPVDHNEWAFSAKELKFER